MMKPCHFITTMHTVIRFESSTSGLGSVASREACDEDTTYKNIAYADGKMINSFVAMVNRA